MKNSTYLVSVLGVAVAVLLNPSAPAAEKTAPKPVVFRVDESFVRETRTLPPEQQVERVAAKLKELNPVFNGKVTHKIEGGKVTELSFNSLYITNLTPVAALTSLKKLECPSRGERRILTDLSPLKGLPLTSLDCSQSRVEDLSPLKGMKLTSLKCGWSKVADLSPLRGMPLATLAIDGSLVESLAPLKEMALTDFNCNFTKVADLSPLSGAPLKELNCEHTAITDLGPLRGTPIVRLICSNTKITDLSPLQRMALLTSFKCAFTPVRDLAPLAGLKLASLDIRDSQVADLSVLRGLPLERLYMSYTKIRDLTPLAGSTTLALLECYAADISDFSPLKDTKIKDLNCDFIPSRDLATITEIKSLQRLNGTAVAQLKEIQLPSVASAIRPRKK